MKLITIILKENRRIKDKLKTLTPEQMELYKEAYADATLYADKLATYQRVQGQKFQLNKRIQNG